MRRVTDGCRSEYPELQLFVLDFMLNMFTQRPHTVTLCRRYRLWDRLFSEFFLYAGREANMRMTAEQAALNKKRDRVFTMLQKSTLSFLEFAATRPANDNVEECQKLLVRAASQFTVQFSRLYRSCSTRITTTPRSFSWPVSRCCASCSIIWRKRNGLSCD